MITGIDEQTVANIPPYKEPKTYTERKFFTIPIKVYDLYSLMNVEQEEERQANNNQGLLEPIPVQYAMAQKDCIPEHIIGYVQGNNKGQSIDDIEAKGFTCTVVSIKEGKEVGVYECLWDINKFREKLNERMELI